jgi:hypothetical protein
VWFFWKVWHGFQGGRTSINAPRKFVEASWHVFRGIRTVVWRHRNRGANLQFIAENSGKNFEEFGLYPV